MAVAKYIAKENAGFNTVDSKAFREMAPQCLNEGMRAWGIKEKKIACITTDNGANIVAAVRELQWPWLSCFGHNLNVADNNSLSKEKRRTDRAFGVCRSINAAFSHSWQRRKAQEELGLPDHRLITDGAMRWGSKFAMTERILEQLSAIKTVYADDRSHSNLPQGRF
ncbi:zinc finger BED domain-containing protein 4-like [Epinephelus moara]|uniref:zinc finger BED domain-containing protein 4-like n=1 Tax=Epinephelus moara TaxID=300413 RepID=UPI00214E7BEF|nr:zinc finger BED domain-containing protein 4-like [Epinephelus moara]